LKETIADSTGVTTDQIKNFLVTSSSTRRLSDSSSASSSFRQSRQTYHDRRRLSTYTWVVAFDIQSDLSSAGVSSSSEFADTVNTQLSDSSFTNQLTTNLPTTVDSVGSISTIATTRHPSMIPTSIPEKSAKKSKNSKGSIGATILLIFIILFSILIIFLLFRFFYKSRYQIDIDNDQNSSSSSPPSKVNKKSSVNVASTNPLGGSGGKGKPSLSFVSPDVTSSPLPPPPSSSSPSPLFSKKNNQRITSLDRPYQESELASMSSRTVTAEL